MLHRHDIQWVAPAPLWDRRLENEETERFKQPARFHFQRDGYVEELGKRLEEGPTAVEEGVLTSQLWKEKDLPQGVAPEQPDGFPKLYQPLHERYYTVSASLVCRRQGLPDRSVARVDEETVSMVLRRLVPTSNDQQVDPDNPDTYTVYGWMEGYWQQLDDMERVDQSSRGEGGESVEKRYPMFPTSYVPDSPLERPPKERRVWNALIPTTDREEFLSAEFLDATSTSGPPSTDSTNSDSNSVGRTSVDPRLTQLQVRVLDPLGTLRKHVGELSNDLEGDDIDQEAVRVSTSLAFALLDLWTFLTSHVEPVAEWIEQTSEGDHPGASAGPSLDPAEKRLLKGLDTEIYISGLGSTWLDAVRKAQEKESDLARGKASSLLPPNTLKTNGNFDADSVEESLRAIATWTSSESEEGPTSSALYKKVSTVIKSGGGDKARKLQVPPSPGNEEAVFRARCVYERPRCTPYFEPVVSEPTRAFRLASVMDMKAPARDHQFAMPDAGGPEDFRDTSKGVSVRISQKLNEQIQRVKNVTMTDLGEEEVPDQQDAVAMVCRLSLPIITICALILLLVMVNVLNFIFYWLPYFMICFPVPSGGDS